MVAPPIRARRATTPRTPSSVSRQPGRVTADRAERLVQASTPTGRPTPQTPASVASQPTRVTADRADRLIQSDAARGNRPGGPFDFVPGGPDVSTPPAATTPEETPTTPSPIDWRDAAYNAQIASLNRALADYETGARTNLSRYGEDFMRGLGSLGFRAGEGFQAAPDVTQAQTAEAAQAAIQNAAIRSGRNFTDGWGAATEGGFTGDLGERIAINPGAGSWDYEGAFNPFSSAARGTRSSRDEFAGRGMLRSSDFAQSYADFQDRLNQQLEAMGTGRTRFLEDISRGVLGQQTSTQEAREQAEREARARAAAMAAQSGATVMD
jgi:hypothetical protein